MDGFEGKPKINQERIDRVREMIEERNAYKKDLEMLLQKISQFDKNGEVIGTGEIENIRSQFEDLKSKIEGIENDLKSMVENKDSN